MKNNPIGVRWVKKLLEVSLFFPELSLWVSAWQHAHCGWWVASAADTAGAGSWVNIKIKNNEWQSFIIVEYRTISILKICNLNRNPNTFLKPKWSLLTKPNSKSAHYSIWVKYLFATFKKWFQSFEQESHSNKLRSSLVH